MSHGAPSIHIGWLTERRLRVAFAGEAADAPRVLAAYRRLVDAQIPGVLDVIPAFRAIHAELAMAAVRQNGEAILRQVEEIVLAAADHPPIPARLVEVPVCYDPEFALDLAEVAAQHGLTPDAAASLHASAEYTVRFIGFSPGFPYLSGLPELLATPRLPSPRPRVPAGSIAIAAAQAGIYPRPTAGGWRILGRTPLNLFDPAAERPALLAACDRVRFSPISRETFDALLGARR